MSLALAFDTHSFVKQLVATGFTEEQAETQVRLLSEILETQLSTKADLAKVDGHVLELKHDIKALDAKIETIRAELQRDLKAAEVKLAGEIKALDVKLAGEIKTLDVKLEREMKTADIKIESIKAELQLSTSKAISEAKMEIIRWVAGMFIAQSALLIGAIFAMIRFSGH